MSRWYPCVYCTEDLHCTKYEEPGYESRCVLGPCTEEAPSHGDQIRRMSDEELAKKISGIESFALTCGGGWPPEKWLEWLKQEVK